MKPFALNRRVIPKTYQDDYYVLRHWADRIAKEWGCPQPDSVYYRDATYEDLDFPRRDSAVFHYTKRDCVEVASQNIGPVLCIRITKSKKTAFLSEHAYHKCKLICGRSKE